MGGCSAWTKEKLPRDSKNWCRAETVERCSIDRTRLIEYNWVQSRVRVHELMNNEDRCSGITLRVKRRGPLIVRLKAIESREDTFRYLSSYLHRSFLWHLVIVTFIHCIIESPSRLPRPLYRIENVCSYRCAIGSSAAIESSRPWVAAEKPRE